MVRPLSCALDPSAAITVPSLIAQQKKNPPALWETQQACAQSLRWEDPLEQESGNPPQYSCLNNPMDRGAGRLQAKGLQRVRHN